MALQPIGVIPGSPTTITMTSANPGVVTWGTHNLWPGSQIQFYTTGALPTNVVAFTTYYVLSTGFALGSFQFAATPGGAAINTTSGTQSGTHSAAAILEGMVSGQQTMANSAGVAIASDQSAVSTSSTGTSVTVTPTITAGAYTAGWVIGGIQTFANILPASFNGMLQSISLRFKGTVQTVEFDVAIFTASPAGTFANAGAPAIATADTALLLDVFQMTQNVSSLGTHTIYNLDGIGKQINGSATSLYAVVVAVAAPVNPASTSDMSLVLGVSW